MKYMVQILVMRGIVIDIIFQQISVKMLSDGGIVEFIGCQSHDQDISPLFVAFLGHS